MGETDGTSLLMTDGGNELVFLNPETMEQEHKVTINDNGTAVEMVNELEMVDGQLWGSIFGKECMVQIDPKTGLVKAYAMLHGLFDRKKAKKKAELKGHDPPGALAGIAWEPKQKRLFVTGNYWPKIYEIELVEEELDERSKARQMCIPVGNMFK